MRRCRTWGSGSLWTGRRWVYWSNKYSGLARFKSPFKALLLPPIGQSLCVGVPSRPSHYERWRRLPLPMSRRCPSRLGKYAHTWVTAKLFTAACVYFLCAMLILLCSYAKYIGKSFVITFIVRKVTKRLGFVHIFKPLGHVDLFESHSMPLPRSTRSLYMVS